MRWRPLRRAATAYVIAIGMVALLSGGLIGGTFALFTAETTNANSTFAGGWVDPPSTLTATPSGYTMGLTWVPGTHGPVTGQQLYGVDNANTSSCTGVTYAAIGSAMTASAATYTDTSRGTAANNGDWFCYQLVSTTATSWTASAVQPVQLGLVATSITWTNVTTPGTLTNGDQLTIAFNQKTNLAASGTISVCARTTGGIRIGATGGCSNTIGVNIGVISGGVVGANKNFTSSGFVTTAAAPFTLTITFGGSGGGTPGTTFSGTSTFTGPASIATSVKSSLTPVAVLCARTVSACQPTTTSLP